MIKIKKAAQAAHEFLAQRDMSLYQFAGIVLVSELIRCGVSL